MLGVFLDTETNGLNAQVHQIVEIAFIIIDLVTGEEKETYQSLIAPSLEMWERSDPESLKINEFSWDEVSHGKALPVVAKEVIECFARWSVQRKKAVFICQNPSFDRVFFSQLIDVETQEKLNWPYHWLDLASMHWSISMDRAKRRRGPPPWESGLSKDMIAQFYALPPEEKPHRAMNGVKHLLTCYRAVVGFLGRP